MKTTFKIALLLILLTSPLMLLAQQVSTELAKQKALTFLTQSGKSSTNRSASNKAPRLILANDRDEFYVFNDEVNGGYVVVSGDERMPDVLGYSYTGHFDAENIPCNMRAWLEDYASQVIYLRSHPEAQASRRTTTSRDEISPLLKCHFNQGKYYNDKCPLVDGEHAVTGCVATAMAQIMYYYQWPKQTTDSIPGYTSDYRKIDMPAIPVTTIDWDNILEQYNSEEEYSDEQIDAISTLMMLCGTSVNMDYATMIGSSATCSSAARALRRYFYYDDLAEYIERQEGSLEVWVQMLYDELNNGRPVFYSGSSWIGHAFVLDGYKDGYFHVNWGWGGNSDDYYLLTDLGGFDYGQDAIIGIQPAYPDNPSRYAVLDNEKMTLYYDNEKLHRTGTIISHRDDWRNYADQITECVIDSSFVNLEAKSLKSLFSGLRQLKSIQGLEYLNTSMVLNMSRFFSDCSSLTSLDVSGFKTNNVTDMSLMFAGCRNLTSLDVSRFKTDNVGDMRGMFEYCSNLTNLEVSGFKTNNVTDMSWMFAGCRNLTSLDVSRFKTDNVGDMRGMFEYCSNLTSLDVSGFKTDNVRDMSLLFQGCSSLANLDMSGFTTDNVTNMEEMFLGCANLTSLDVSGFKTDNVRNMSSMFQGCSSLTNLDVSGFKSFFLSDMGEMFSGCSGLTNLNVNGLKAHYVQNLERMFYGCSNLTNLDVSALKTDFVSNMKEMFAGCTNLTSLDLSSFNTYNVTDMERMFSDCSNLTTIYASERWDMSNVNKSDDMFKACNSLVGGAGTTHYKGIATTDSIIAEKDWTGGFSGGYPYWYEFDESQTNGSVTSNPDGIAIYVDKTVGKCWEPQVMVIPFGNFSLKQGNSYKVIATAKFPTNGALQINMGKWDNYYQDTVNVVSTGDFQKIEILFPNFAQDLEDCFLLFQCGDFLGTTILKKIQVMEEINTIIEGSSGGDYAHIDGGPEDPGYFTYKDSKLHTITYIIEDKVYMIQTYEYGDQIINVYPPVREGYDFVWADLPETMPDHDIVIYGVYTTAITDLLEEKHPVKVFSLEGRAQNKMQKGINIIRYSDGSVRKVLVK